MARKGSLSPRLLTTYATQKVILTCIIPLTGSHRDCQDPDFSCFTKLMAGLAGNMSWGIKIFMLIRNLGISQ